MRIAREEPWHPISTAPEGVWIETKIDDGAGVRNEQEMQRRGLWWLNDRVYAYYTPTHWRHIRIRQSA